MSARPSLFWASWDRRGGEVCVRGTRLPVATLVEELMSGASTGDIQAAYPNASNEVLDELRTWLVDTGSTPPAAPAPEPTVCGGFRWIGQTLASCDGCGFPAWEHPGIETVTGDSPFDTAVTVRPWSPGEREHMRAKWGGGDA